MTLKVKICGLSTEITMAATLAAGADYVGLVFYPRSPRHVSLAKAAQLAKMASGKAQTVALLVNPDDQLLDRVMANVAPDIVQLHGVEPPERVAEIARRIEHPVLKAISVETADDAKAALAYEQSGAWILFDAKPPKQFIQSPAADSDRSVDRGGDGRSRRVLDVLPGHGGAMLPGHGGAVLPGHGGAVLPGHGGAVLPGGNGLAFDWRHLAAIKDQMTFMLSGGLNPATVGEAIAMTQAAAVDVSSGVETAPGVKDKELIAQFIKAAKAAGHSIDKDFGT